VGRQPGPPGLPWHRHIPAHGRYRRDRGRRIGLPGRQRLCEAGAVHPPQASLPAVHQRLLRRHARQPGHGRAGHSVRPVGRVLGHGNLPSPRRRALDAGPARDAGPGICDLWPGLAAWVPHLRRVGAHLAVALLRLGSPPRPAAGRALRPPAAVWQPLRTKPAEAGLCSVVLEDEPPAGLGPRPWSATARP